MSYDGETSASDIGSAIREEPFLFSNKKQILEGIIEGKETYSPLWVWVKDQVASRPCGKRAAFLRRTGDEESELCVESLEQCLFGVVLLHLNVLEDAYDFVSNDKAREPTHDAMVSSFSLSFFLTLLFSSTPFPLFLLHVFFHFLIFLLIRQ